MEVFLVLNQIFPVIAAGQGVFFLMSGLIFLIIGLSALLFAVWLKMTRLQKKLNGRFTSRFFTRTKNNPDSPGESAAPEGENSPASAKLSSKEQVLISKGGKPIKKEKEKRRAFRQVKGVRNTQGVVTFKSMKKDEEATASKVKTRKKIILDQPPTPRPTRKPVNTESNTVVENDNQVELAELWFYTAKDQEFGPVPKNELKSLIERAALDNDSFIRRGNEPSSSAMTASDFSEYYFSHGYFKFRCPVCGQKIKSRFNWAGRRHNCPGCSTALLIPVYNPDSDSIAAEA
jgi:hypothetical protein